MSGRAAPPERGIFVQLDVSPACTYGAGCRACIDACPVDIFAGPDPDQGGRAAARPELEDECILCMLCVDRCPEGAVTLRKLYPSPAGTVFAENRGR